MRARIRIGFMAILLIGAALSTLAQPGPVGAQGNQGNNGNGNNGNYGNNGNQGPGNNKGPGQRHNNNQGQCNYGHGMNKNGKCQECGVGCAECSWDNNGNNKCNQCEKDVCLHSDGSCVMAEDCGDGWSCKEGNCIQCNDNSMFGQGCVDCDRKWCHECDENHVMDRWNKQCKPQCDDDEFEMDGKCHPCPPGCAKCLSENVCLACENTDFDPSTGCTTCLCGDSVAVFDNSQKKFVCKRCSDLFGENCETCCAERCLTCNSDLMTVVTTNSGSSCKLCSDPSIGGPGCLECSSTKCFECAEGFFLDTSTNKCKACTIANCEECSSANKCTDCDCGFVLAGDGTCKVCSDIGGTGCLSCSSTKCLECDEGFFLDATGKCTACSMLGCNECTSATKCTNCGESFVLSSTGTCVVCSTAVMNCLECDGSECVVCREGFFLTTNPTTGATSCTACSAAPGNFQNCADCTSAGCTECIDDRFVVTTTSVGGLPAGSCAPCSFVFNSHCATCSSTACTSCTTSFRFPVGKDCESCNDKFSADCLQCDFFECQICTPGTFLVQSLAGTGSPCEACVTKYATNQCILCDENHCLACANGANPFNTPPCT